MDAYVGKPIQARSLWEVIHHLMSKDKEESSSTAGTTIGENLDMQGAIDQLAGDQELLQELVRVFLEQWPDWRQQLSSALAAADRTTLRRLGHTLKSALGQFALAEARDAAARLETLDDGANKAAGDEACAALVCEIERALPKLEAFAKSPV